jgi:hypothetical protein
MTLRYPHIFTVMLASTDQFNFYLILFVVTLYWIDFTNLVNVNMSNLIAKVIQWIPRILTSLPMTLRQTAHPTRHGSRQLMISTYFMEMSCRTLSFSVIWPSIGVSVPLISNMRSLVHHRMISRPLHPSSRDRSTSSPKGKSAIAMKFGQEIRTSRLLLTECFIDVVDAFNFFSRRYFVS